MVLKDEVETNCLEAQANPYDDERREGVEVAIVAVASTRGRGADLRRFLRPVR